MTKTFNHANGTISSTREHGDTEGLDSEVCCSADKSKCICFSLKNSILETDVSATDVAGI